MAFVVDKPSVGETDLFPDGLNAVHIDEAMRQLHIPEFAYTYLVRCRPQNGKFPPGDTSKKLCADHMWNDLVSLNPDMIVCLGASAFKAVTGYDKFSAHVGRLIEVETPIGKRKVLTTHMPSAAYHDERRADEINAHLDMIPALLDAKGAEPDDVNYTYCDTLEKVREAIEDCRRAGAHSLDTETSGTNPYRAENEERNAAKQGDFVAVVSLSPAPRKAYVIPIDHAESPWVADPETKGQVWALLMGLLTDPAVEVGGSNVSFDLAILEWNEAQFNGRVEPLRTLNVAFDTQVAQHLIDEESPKGLKYLAAQYEGVYGYGDEVESAAAADLKQHGYSKVPMETLWWYAAMDADMSMRLRPTLENKLKEDNLWDLYRKQEMGSVRVCVDMRHAGWFINQTKLEENQKLFSDRLKEVTGSLFDYASVKRFEYDRVVTLVKEKANLAHLVCNIIAHDPDLFRRTWSAMPECIEWIIAEAEKKRKDRNVEALREYDVFHHVVWWVIEQDRANVSEWMPKSYNWDFNPNSPQQLAALLFDYQQYPVIKRSDKSGLPSTDKNVLAELVRKDKAAHPVAEGEPEYEGFAGLLTRYRRVSKVYSVNVVTVPSLVDRQNVLHTNLKVDGTMTGRLSSSDPNLQNIPWDRDVKLMFHTRFGPWWPKGHPWYRETAGTLIQIDYSQLELRIAAAFSQDEGMIATFVRGDDMHSWTASLVFGKPPEEISDEERRFAKTVAFGLIYGRSVGAIAEAMGYSEEYTQKLVDTWFDRVPGLKRWIAAIQADAKKQMYVRNPFGRRRWCRDIKSSDATQQGHAKRVAVNSPIQSAAADICKDVMVDVGAWLTDGGYSTLMILQIHDSLIFDCPPEEAEFMMANLPGLMVREYDWLNGVPLVVDAESGLTWGNFKDDDDAEAPEDLEEAEGVAA